MFIYGPCNACGSCAAVCCLGWALPLAWGEDRLEWCVLKLQVLCSVGAVEMRVGEMDGCGGAHWSSWGSSISAACTWQDQECSLKLWADTCGARGGEVMLHPAALVRGLWAMTGIFPTRTSCALAAFALLISESLHGDRAERSTHSPLVPPSAVTRQPHSTALSLALPVPIPTAAGSISKPAWPNRCLLPPSVPLFGWCAVALVLLQQQ